MIIQISWLFLLIASKSIQTSCANILYECPEPEEIFPCYCEDDDGDPWVHCNHLTTPKQVQQGAEGLKKYKLYKMSFFKNAITEPLESDVFKGATVDRILFENSTIVMKSPQLTGLENSLSSLQLRACFNETYPMGNWSLSHLKSLRELIVDKNKITTLKNNWMTSFPDTLRTLTVEGNKIITLEDSVFAKLEKLSFLVLDDNRITSVKRSMFPNPALALRSISLNNNRLRYLPFDIFNDMPSLRMIEIENNLLTSLTESAWVDVIKGLIKLSVLGNPFDCNNSFKWFVEIRKPSLMEGKCQKPESLQGRSLYTLKSSDLE